MVILSVAKQITVNNICKLLEIRSNDISGTSICIFDTLSQMLSCVVQAC